MFSLLIAGCSDGTIGDTFADDYYQDQGASLIIPTNVTSGFFDLGDTDNASADFDLILEGAAPSNVDINVSFRGTDATIASGVSVPSTHSFSVADVLSATGVDLSTVEVGESCTFTFDATNGTGVNRSSRSLTVPFSCFSSLAGTYDFVTADIWCGEPNSSGQATWTEVGAGLYEIDDWAYGSYQACYGGGAASWGSLQISDVCNKLTVLGLDNYDDTWTLGIDDISGSDLTIRWSNTYGETGTTTLTRTDGSEWPPISF